MLMVVKLLEQSSLDRPARTPCPRWSCLVKRKEGLLPTHNEVKRANENEEIREGWTIVGDERYGRWSCRVLDLES